MDFQEEKIYTAIIVAGFVIGFVVIYFFYSVIRQHRRMLSLQKEHSDAEIEAIEKDRARIAADIHDELAPMLVAVKMKVNSFDLYEPTDLQHLQSANTTIDNIAKRMRTISFNLMPVTLIEKGLEKAVREFIYSVQTRNGLHISLYPFENAPAIEVERAVHMYRIVQEIIHNTIKHAKASELTIALATDEKTIIIASRDNGIGFNYDEEIKNKKGFGLGSLMNRVNLLNGELKIDSKPGTGTAIHVEIPN